MNSANAFYGLFNDSFPPIMDGVTLTIENYAKWMSKRGLSPIVVTPWNEIGYKADYEVLRYLSFPIIGRRPYRFGCPQFDPFIWKKLLNRQFKLVHSHCPFSSGRLARYVAHKQKVPFIATFHSKYRTDLEHQLKHFPNLVSKIMSDILEFYNSCDEVWIPQACVEDTIREYGFKGRVTVVENGNDLATKICGDVVAYKKLSRRKLNIADEEIALLFVGQHIWAKGIDVIVEALSLLKQRNVKFRMNFIGTGFALSDLKEMIHKYDLESNVKVNGVISDRNLLSDYYAASDLFLFPSFYDNAPLVVKEAAAMGTPAILPIGSTSAEIIYNGKNGYVAEKNAGAYAALIEKIASDRASLTCVGLEARATLARSWEAVVDEVIDRYDVILKKYNKK